MNTWVILGTLVFVLALMLVTDMLVQKKETKHKMSFMEGLNLTGLPVVTMVNNGKKLNFVLDTGSVHSLINKSVIQYIEYNETEYVATLSGIDNITREEENAIEIPLQYKGKVTRSIFVVTELSACFDEIKKETGVQLHGLLGSDFFVENRYIIDYNEMVAYSKRI